jgi:hypothetical protein
MSKVLTHLQRAAKSIAAEDNKEKKNDERRQYLLGRRLMQLLRTDAALRERFAVEMSGYCSRPHDREVFRLDEDRTWFDALVDPAAPPSAAPGPRVDGGKAPDASTRSDGGRSAPSAAQSACARTAPAVTGAPPPSPVAKA